MKKRTVAIILELVPIISALISFIFIKISYDAELITWIIYLTTLLSFLGFIFFFIGRKLYKKDKTVRILGILDWLCTIYVIMLYILAIFAFGL